MEMHQVRYFLAVARTLNFTRAAQQCDVTQPSLTRAVQKLEDELGGLLFRRERALTHLTDLGRSMLPHLARTYEAAQAAKALARGIGNADVAPLALGITTSVAGHCVAAIVGEVARGLGGLELTMSSDSSAELLAQVLRGDVDLALIEAPADTPARIEAWPLFEQRYVAAAAERDPLAARGSLALADAAGCAWIDCGGDGGARLRRAARVAGVEVGFRHRVGSPARAIELVEAGIGAAVLAEATVANRPGIVGVPFGARGFTASMVLAGVAGRRRSPAAEAVVRAARALDWR